jgi:hypothetical protein
MEQTQAPPNTTWVTEEKKGTGLKGTAGQNMMRECLRLLFPSSILATVDS